MKKKLALLFSMMMLFVTLVGCDKKEAPTGEVPTPVADGSKEDGKETPTVTPEIKEEVKRGGVFNNYFTGDIDTINPHIYTLANSSDVFALATMRLYVQVPNEDRESFSLVGEFAKGEPVQIDDEGLLWEIEVHDNATWENGDAINIDDLIYSWKMCLDPILINSRASQLASDYITIKNANEYYLQGAAATTSWEDVGIKRVDDYTISVELTDPVTADDIKNHFNYSWTSLVHEATYEAGMDSDRAKTNYGSTREKFMSNGRFILTTWINGSQVSMDRNPNYIDADSTMLDGYTYKMLDDQNTALALFLAGDLDVVSLNATVVEQYIDDPRVKIAPANSIQTLTINHGNTNNKGILSNLNFRKALFYAVDRGRIAGMTNGIAANYLVPQKCLGDRETNETFREMTASQAYLSENFGYDKAKAKEYYDLAMTETGLDSLTLTLQYNETSDNNKAASEFLHKELPEIFGSTFKLELLAGSSSVLNTYVRGWKDGDPNSFELQWRGWNTSTPAPWNGLKVYNSTYSNKNEPYYNEAFDALWEEANNSIEAKLDPDFRLELTRQMEVLALEDIATVPVYEAPRYFLINENVELAVNFYVPGYGFGYPLSRFAK